MKVGVLRLAGLALAGGLMASAASAQIWVEKAVDPAGFTWRGPYVGVFGGYGLGTFGGIAAGSISGPIAGGYVGFNFQNGAGVVGVEFDAAWSGMDDGGARAVTWIGSFRGRIGWALGQWLPFLQYGFSYAGVVISGATHAELHPEIGIGVQRAINDRLFARADYLLTFDEKMSPAGTELMTHEFRIGVGTQF
ncbi:MAG: outer membrane beta-barrel protein [Bauldia sp.]|nr:outer membrane beta-barrel protein [Bauldia sp.]